MTPKRKSRKPEYLLKTGVQKFLGASLERPAIVYEAEKILDIGPPLSKYCVVPEYDNLDLSTALSKNDSMIFLATSSRLRMSTWTMKRCLTACSTLCEALGEEPMSDDVRGYGPGALNDNDLESEVH